MAKQERKGSRGIKILKRNRGNQKRRLQKKERKIEAANEMGIKR